ncbi:unnamed protein product [Prorocentrum cordatum]|uniref:Uncharacterized protein n=1 Tax=Prorocentrum cordatum TaxID=2364126 RepID=A0ABN9X0J4_9DINO|nr:unnamed protein product [Polarella glacialis]
MSSRRPWGRGTSAAVQPGRLAWAAGAPARPRGAGWLSGASLSTALSLSPGPGRGRRWGSGEWPTVDEWSGMRACAMVFATRQQQNEATAAAELPKGGTTESTTAPPRKKKKKKKKRQPKRS